VSFIIKKSYGRYTDFLDYENLKKKRKIIIGYPPSQLDYIRGTLILESTLELSAEPKLPSPSECPSPLIDQQCFHG
jgi:hypothetical protein